MSISSKPVSTDTENQSRMLEKNDYARQPFVHVGVRKKGDETGWVALRTVYSKHFAERWLQASEYSDDSKYDTFVEHSPLEFPWRVRTDDRMEMLEPLVCYPDDSFYHAFIQLHESMKVVSESKRLPTDQAESEFSHAVIADVHRLAGELLSAAK